MKVHIVSNVNGHVLKLTPRDFGKLLHVARLHGWSPERISGDWPSSTWDTQIILPHIGSYMPGVVSDADAEELVRALRVVTNTGHPIIKGPLYLELLTLIEVAKWGSFDVRFETADVMQPKRESETAVLA